MDDLTLAIVKTRLNQVVDKTLESEEQNSERL